MSEEEKIKISVNEEDMQNLINCYKKDIEYIMQLEKENQKYKEVINKAIKLIEDSYYSKNTTDIDSIVVSGDKLLQVRKILKGVEECI